MTAVRAAVGAPWGVLTIFGHGNGLDLQLPAGGVLCAMAGLAARPEEGPTPHCQVVDRCVRVDQPLARALAEEVVHPREVRARIVVLATCFGTLPADGFVDHRWGFIGALLKNPHVEAVITTWRASIISTPDLWPAISALYRGAPVAHVVAALNQAPSATRFCLFGDPDARLPQTTDPRAYAGAAAPRRPRRVAGKPAGPRRTFASACLAGTGTPVAPRAVTQRPLLAALAAHPPGPIIHLWHPFSQELVGVEEQCCWHCGAMGVVEQFRVAAQDMVRRVRTCPRCPLLEDVQREAAIRLDIGDGELRLTTSLTLRDAAAVLYVGGQDLPTAAWVRGLRTPTERWPGPPRPLRRPPAEARFWPRSRW